MKWDGALTPNSGGKLGAAVAGGEGRVGVEPLKAGAPSEDSPGERSDFGPPPREGVRLEGGEVQVWCASLSAPREVVEAMRRTLSPDESERAGRFHFERHREDFVVARGLLRTLVGRYLDAPPGELRFAYTPYGKPHLAGAFRDSRLRFNLSHSHELALYAFTDGAEVGIDVEHVRPDMAGEEIARRFFSPREVAALFALAPGERDAAFFQCWTRKEAFIKAVGEGLSFPLDQFDVSLGPREPAALLSVRGDAGEAARWSVRDVSPAPDYAAALVSEGRGGRVRLWRWRFDA
jgi:4'-phosphopantetheinyl transferase